MHCTYFFFIFCFFACSTCLPPCWNGGRLPDDPVANRTARNIKRACLNATTTNITSEPVSSNPTRRNILQPSNNAPVHLLEEPVPTISPESGILPKVDDKQLILMIVAMVIMCMCMVCCALLCLVGGLMKKKKREKEKIIHKYDQDDTEKHHKKRKLNDNECDDPNITNNY